MKNKEQKKKSATLFVFVLLCIMTGALTGAWIFAFKQAVAFVVAISGDIYAFVRERPIYLPLLILGAGAVGSIAAILLNRSHNCRGGGTQIS